MNRAATFAFTALLTVGCGSDDGASPTSPAIPPPIVTPSPPPPSPSGFPQISVGQRVQATLIGHGSQHGFELTASSTGTLVVRVTMESPAFIALWIAERLVVQTSNSPLVGRVEVIAGQKYELIVADGAPWDYDDFTVRYVLTTTIETPTQASR